MGTSNSPTPHLILFSGAATMKNNLQFWPVFMMLHDACKLSFPQTLQIHRRSHIPSLHWVIHHGISVLSNVTPNTQCQLPTIHIFHQHNVPYTFGLGLLQPLANEYRKKSCGPQNIGMKTFFFSTNSFTLRR